MQRIRFHRPLAVALVTSFFFECSGGLPEDDTRASGGNAGHAGKPTGGASAGLGGTHQHAGGQSAGMAGSMGGAGASGGLVEPSAGTKSTAGAGGSGAAGGASGGTGGSAGDCGARQCDSSLDNDCNQVPDNQETACGCSVPNAERACSTGKFGACASGTQQCQFSQDKAQSAWSACVGPSAKSRDCRSTSDANCNNVPDSQEPECTACKVGTPQACNTHAEDGVGSCKAGTRSCSLASDNASVVLGPCSGDVGPAMEACGPLLADGVTPTPDANCNGIPGDGDYQLGSSCAKAVTIAGKSVRLFAASHPGTAAVHLCTTGCPVGDKLFNYVALSCGADTTDTVLGYATTTQLPKYAAVNITATSCVFDGGTYGPHWNIQVPAQTFYVLP